LWIQVKRKKGKRGIEEDEREGRRVWVWGLNFIPQTHLLS